MLDVDVHPGSLDNIDIVGFEQWNSTALPATTLGADLFLYQLRWRGHAYQPWPPLFQRNCDLPTALTWVV